VEPAFSSAVVEVGDGGLPEIAGVVQVAVAELPEVAEPRATALHPEIVVEEVTPFDSSVKSMVPVGAPEPGELDTTVAVKMTCCPVTEGSTDEVIVVVVVSWFTLWVSEPEEVV
jgi:hypothetical protein